MPAYFLDTSALVKRYHVEDGTAEMDQLLNDPASIPIISRLGLVEMLSAFATKVRTRVSSVDAHDRARKGFLGDLKTRRLVVVRLLVSHYRGAERLVDRHAKSRRLRTLDALQLSVALHLFEQHRIDAFVCADEPLCEVAALENLVTLNPLE